MFLELAQTGTTVTGRACEDFEDTQCNTLQGGQVKDGKLQFFYTFGSNRVDAALEVGEDKLTGTLTSTKAPAPLPFRFTRVP